MVVIAPIHPVEQQAAPPIAFLALRGVCVSHAANVGGSGDGSGITDLRNANHVQTMAECAILAP